MAGKFSTKRPLGAVLALASAAALALFASRGRHRCPPEGCPTHGVRSVAAGGPEGHPPH